MVSNKRLKNLPTIEEIKKLSQSLAMLDAILSPEWESRYYSFNSKWSATGMMASMNDGCGDDYFMLFTSEGAILKGFAHESPMTPYANELHQVWLGILDNVPKEFQEFLLEPAFSLEDTTFCIWRRYADTTWQIGNIKYPEGNNSDGSEELLFILDNKPSTYQRFAEDYYDREINLKAIKHIYQHKPLTDELIRILNPEVTLSQLQADIEEISYGKT